MLKLKLRNSAGLNIDGPFDTFFWLAQRVICIGMASRSIKGFVDVKLLLNIFRQARKSQFFGGSTRSGSLRLRNNCFMLCKAIATIVCRA